MEAIVGRAVGGSVSTSVVAIEGVAVGATEGVVVALFAGATVGGSVSTASQNAGMAEV
jgi:hypothetical protein